MVETVIRNLEASGIFNIPWQVWALVWGLAAFALLAVFATRPRLSVRCDHCGTLIPADLRWAGYGDTTLCQRCWIKEQSGCRELWHVVTPSDTTTFLDQEAAELFNQEIVGVMVISVVPSHVYERIVAMDEAHRQAYGLGDPPNHHPKNTIPTPIPVRDWD